MKQNPFTMYTCLQKSIILTTIVSTTSFLGAFSFSLPSRTPNNIIREYNHGHANSGESSARFTRRIFGIRPPLHLQMSAVENARGPGTGPREVSGSTPGPNIEIKLDRSKPLSKPRKKRVRASPIEILSAKRPQRIKIKKKKEKTNKQRSTHRTASATATATRPRSKSGSGTANRSGTTQRLTKEEETILTENIRELQSLIREYDNLSAAKISSHLLPLIPNAMYKEPNMPFENKPTEEEWAEACNMSVVELRRKLEVGREARSRIVSSNIGLVLQIAKRYDSDLRRSVEGGGGNGVGTILTLNDLVQEGNLGLMEAAEKFESDKGVRFATYAAYWIKHRIIRSITNNSRVIRLPAHGESYMMHAFLISQ